MSLTNEQFYQKTGLQIHHPYYDEPAFGGANEDHLPCFAHRWAVNRKVNTPELISEYIRLASEEDGNDVLVFSVTERDACWDVWKAFALAHPKTFKVVEGGSIHGKYLCRMYIYTKPPTKRKFHPNNIAKYQRR